MSNKEISKKYLDNLYSIGGISSDVYDIKLSDLEDEFED